MFHVLVCVSMSLTIVTCPPPCFHVLVYVSMSSSMFSCPCPRFHLLVHVSMSSSMFLCLYPCFHVLSHVHVHVHVNVHVHFHVMSPYWKQKTESMENGNFRLLLNGKKKPQTAVFLLQTETEFFFLGWKIINGYRQLLCQQTCPSMVKNLVTSGRTSILKWNWRLAQLHRNRNWRLAQLHRNRNWRLAQLHKNWNWRNRAGQDTTAYWVSSATISRIHICRIH